MPLTPKQQRFVDEYLVDLNGSAAYRRAGYAAKNDRVARTEAVRLLAKPSVAAAIAAARAARSARTLVTADRVVLELARIAFTDRRRLATWGPEGVKFTPSAELSEDEAALVAELSETVTEAGGTIRVKLADKLQALHLLGKHLGIFIDRVETTEKTRLVITEEIVDAPGGAADPKPDPPPPPAAG